jgi:hypothetical protein
VLETLLQHCQPQVYAFHHVECFHEVNKTLLLQWPLVCSRAIILRLIIWSRVPRFDQKPACSFVMSDSSFPLILLRFILSRMLLACDTKAILHTVRSPFLGVARTFTVSTGQTRCRTPIPHSIRDVGREARGHHHTAKNSTATPSGPAALLCGTRLSASATSSNVAAGS